jgi:hypothetical protein
LANDQEDGSPDLGGSITARDLRWVLIEYINEPNSTRDRKVKRLALKYTVINGELYRTMEGVLLKCLSEEESKVAMREVHEGLCGSHQLAHKMRWKL